MQGNLDFWSCVYLCGADAVDRVNTWREKVQQQVPFHYPSIGTLKATTRHLPGGRERYVVVVYNPTTLKPELFETVRLECHFYEYLGETSGRETELVHKKIQIAAQVPDEKMGQSFYKAMIELYRENADSPMQVDTTFSKEALFPKF